MHKRAMSISIGATASQQSMGQCFKGIALRMQHVMHSRSVIFISKFRHACYVKTRKNITGNLPINIQCERRCGILLLSDRRPVQRGSTAKFPRGTHKDYYAFHKDLIVRYVCFNGDVFHPNQSS